MQSRYLAMATGGKEERCALTVFWSIENIRSWLEEEWIIQSPDFSSRTLGGKFQFRLFSKCYGRSARNLILVQNPYDYDLDFPLDCEFSFMGSNGSPLVTKTVRNHKFKTSNVVLRPFVSSEEVFETRRSDFLPHDTLTVRCRIWKSEGELSNDEFISLRSRFEGRVDNSFVWSISEFSSLQLNQKVATPVILKFCDGSSEFRLEFSLKGESLEDSEIYLDLTSVSIHKHLNLHLQCTVLDNEQREMICRGEGYSFDEYEETTIDLCIDPLYRTRILMETSNCLSNDILTLFVELSGELLGPSVEFIEREHYGPSNLTKDLLKCTSPFLDVSSQTAEQSLDPSNTSLQVGDSLAVLGDELLNLYRNQSMSDFELSSDDVSFPVHKMVLSARSPVFRAMISSNMEESSSKSLNIPDLDAHTLNRLLTFLYGGTVDSLEWGNALKLYDAADKYKVHSLIRECCSFFRSNISVRNVVDIVTLADRYQDLDLKSFVHGFIMNHFDETVSSPEWTKFLESEAELAGMIMHQMYLRKLEASKS